MTIDRVRELYNAQPFQPFAVRMRDGRRIAVAKRENIGRGPLGYTIAVFAPDDSLHILEVAAIKDLERNADVAVGENGKGMDTTDT